MQIANLLNAIQVLELFKEVSEQVIYIIAVMGTQGWRKHLIDADGQWKKVIAEWSWENVF